jgi:tRNA threonylcarbamoyladenosine biosynthesis protein TsaE
MMRMDALDWQPRWHWQLPSEEDTRDWGARLANGKARGVFYLQGELGAGKTCLVREVLRALGYQDAVPSPSYALVERYEMPELALTHFDLYRLGDGHELEHIGFRDYLAEASSSLCFLEWPEKALDYLSVPDVWLRLSFSSPGRELSAACGTSHGAGILNLMSTPLAP